MCNIDKGLQSNQLILLLVSDRASSRPVKDSVHHVVKSTVAGVQVGEAA